MATSNTRAANLVLLAKGHYGQTVSNQSAARARTVVAFHCGVNDAAISWHDTALVLCNELLPLLPLPLTGRRLTDFLLRLGPDALELNYGNHQDGYYAGLVEAVLEIVAEMPDRLQGGAHTASTPDPRLRSRLTPPQAIPFVSIEGGRRGC